MKGRESGMPEAEYWASFFRVPGIIENLIPLDVEGSIVEFGSGYGTFTIPVAERFSGPVFGFDIECDLVTTVQAEARRRGFTNATIECRDFVEKGTGLGDGFASHIMLYNILHIESPIALLRETMRVLRSGGTMSIMHWRSDIATPRGPSLAIRPRPEQCEEWSEIAGFVDFENIDLGTNAPWHFGLRARKSAQPS